MTLKKEFTFSNLIMLIIPVTAISIATAMLFAVSMTKYIIINTASVREFFRTISESPEIIRAFIVWIVLCIIIIAVTATLITRHLSKNILSTLSDLKVSAMKIENGNLDYEVLKGKYDEINELCDEFNNMRIKLKQSRENEKRLAEEKNLLLAHLSHDLKTPITAIRGYAEGIADGVASTPEKLNSYINTIISKTDILENLAGNLSEYSHLELNRTEFKFMTGDICDFLRDVFQVYEKDFKNNNMTLTADIPDTIITVNADFEKLYRVFSNILDNSIKYRRTDSKITQIKLSSGDGGVYITVTDDGKGISSENTAKVFDNFYRENSARTMNIKGNGLGLGIAKKITEHHGGRIWLTAAETHGTVATVYLPVYKEKNI